MKSIIVSGLSKRYRVSSERKESVTLVKKLADFVFLPWRNFKSLRLLNDFSFHHESLFWAIQDLSFEVQAGEIVGIIGKNGAGKSTLLKILSQITEPTHGRAEIFGRVGSLLEVGTGFHPELSGRENVYMNGTILGMTRKEIDRKLEEIVDFSGIGKFIDTPVKFYSSGMKVRLGFSVAAHLEPEILIVDEVLAVGDFEFQKKCLGKMEEVSKGAGRTVLFVSHQLSMISSLCTRTILLDKGSVLYDGDTNTAITKYLKTGEDGKREGTNYSDFLVDGNKEILISDIRINSATREVDSLRPFSLDIFLSKGNQTIGYNAKIDVRIDDVLGNRMIWMSTKVKPGIDLNKLEVNFRIPRLPLVSGEYFVTVYIHDGANVASYYLNVISFFVKDSEYFFNNVKIPTGQTNFIVDYEVS